ncbi:MAG TPA: hypothetical protein VL137_07570 [Polyangiaceae bacterium]|nr:hypothetical protein [Polyangiaceae bacterium]
MTWPQICRTAEFKGLWVALDNCRYDEATMKPIEGDVVDSDEELAALCGRMREARKCSCAILFCDGEVLIQQQVTQSSQQTESAVEARTH